MELYLMQHALACSAEEDPQRVLTPEGVAQAKASARGMRRLGLEFDLIVSSPKRRAQQTAALVAEAVRYPYSDILASDAVLPDQPLEPLLKLLAAEPVDARILVVGHLPHLEHLATQLLHGGVLVFENAGLVALELTGWDDARLLWLLTPRQLALLS